MKLHTNRLDPRFCPVTYLLLYLKVTGYKKGPIFKKDSTRTDSWMPRAQ